MGTTTILVCNHKGGVGKTMLSVHLAAYAANLEPGRALAVDTDPQGSLARWRARTEGKEGTFPEVRHMRPAALRKEWSELAAKYAVIVVDTPPSISEAVEAFAPLVSHIVVPVTPAGAELDALRTTLANLPRERVRLVLNRCDAGRGARVVRRVLESYGLPLSIVRDYVAFRDASLGGGTVFERYPSGNAAEDARRLAREVFS